MKRTTLFPMLILSAGLTLIGCSGSQKTAAAPQEPRQETHALHNLHQLTPELFSAGEPVGEAAYEELASLGIKTVISVDGIAPNKELAQRHGMQVVHIPISYDGITEEQAKALAHAMATMPRPIFVNCHHGKHRGPAALCVGAVGSGDITNEQAIEYMKLARTSPKYPGLWKAAKAAEPLSEAELHDDSIVLVEEARIEDFVAGMAEIDRLNELLNDCADIGFQAPEDHPDLAPISLAGQIHNLLREMEDDEIVDQHPEDFRAMLIGARDAAETLEAQLDRDDIKGALRSLDRLNNSCGDCHTKYRNSI